MNTPSIARPQSAILATNKVLKNTYILLSATLVFSAIMAAVSMSLHLPAGASMLLMIGAIVMGMFVLPRTANSTAGIGVIFAITGMLGLSLGPILTSYLALPNGANIIMTAFGGTGIIFLGLSGYALTTRKDFSFMGGFLIAGMLMIFVAAIANIFLHMPAISLAISSVVIMIMSGFILYDTSRIINGGETNYIMATFGLYLNIFNIFIHLLNLLGMLGDD